MTDSLNIFILHWFEKQVLTIYNNYAWFCFWELHLDPYSPTILMSSLCLQNLHIWMQHNFWLNKPYDLANQKFCYIQIPLNVEKSREQDKK